MANTVTTEFDAAVSGTAPSGASTGIVGLYKAVIGHFVLVRQRRVDAEVGKFLESHGGHLTDDLERQISRRFGTHASY